MLPSVQEEAEIMCRLLRMAVAGSVIAIAGSVNAAIDDKAAASLMGKVHCTACHDAERRLVGPSFRDIALKRKAEKDGAAMLMKKVREGGTGAYGQIPMPPNPKTKISDEELKKLIDWILSK